MLLGELMGSLQMGFHRDEEQMVQSGTWEGDGRFRLWPVLPAARVGSKEKESAPGATDAASNNSLAVPRRLDDAEGGH